MKNAQAVSALSALAQEHRLAIYRRLVEAGPEGMAAGAISGKLKVAPSSLSFHLSLLAQAGLIVQRREGRSLIYSADFSRMTALIDYLTENCCAGAPCAPTARRAARAKGDCETC